MTEQELLAQLLGGGGDKNTLLLSLLGANTDGLGLFFSSSISFILPIIIYIIYVYYKKIIIKGDVRNHKVEKSPREKVMKFVKYMFIINFITFMPVLWALYMINP